MLRVSPVRSGKSRPRARSIDGIIRQEDDGFRRMFKTFFLNLSLTKKLIFMMLFLTAILLVTLITIYWQSEKNMLAQIESQTAELAQAVQVGVEEVTGGATSETRLEQYLTSLKTKGIKEISIISNADEIIASTNPNKVGTPVSQKKKELIIKAELGEPAVDQEGKAYNVIIPVIAGQAHYGYIHLQINVESLQETMRRNTTMRIIAALSVFAIGIVISTFLSIWYTGPIHNVVAAARKVAAGDLDQNLPVDRKDEIGDLTRSFNDMVQKLREQRRLEERLREAEHLSAVGQLARGIAHEIRNPLNFISLSIDHIRTKYRPQDGAQAEGFVKLVESMKGEIHRLDRLVRDFLDYGKPLKLDLQPVQTQELLADVVEIVKAKAESDHIQIIERYEALPQTPDGCGTHEKLPLQRGQQRLPGHAGRRIADDRDGRTERMVCASPERHGNRCVEREPHADLRAFLHDQEPGARPGPCHDEASHRGARRKDRIREHRGSGQRGDDQPPSL